jgi:hypothetical protein
MVSSTLPATVGRDAARLTRRDWITLLVAFGIGTALYLWRVWDRIATPGIYAEDGNTFYIQADRDGLAAIFRPYAGYLHLTPRLAAALVSPFGLPAVPLAYTLITVAATLGGFAVVLSRRVDRFIPTVWGRGLAFVMLCLVPPMWESATSIAYLIFLGGVPLLLLGLSRSPATLWGKIVEGVAVAVLGLSGPLIVFYSPVFAYRWLRHRTWANAALGAVAAVTALVQIVVYTGYGRETVNFGFTIVPRTYLQRIVGELLAEPHSVLDAFETRTILRALSILFLLVILVAAVIEVRWDAVVALGLSGFAFAWAVRTYGIALLDPDNGDRHMMLPAAILLLTMVATLAHAVNRADQAAGRQRWWHGGIAIVSGLALLATAGGITAAFRIPQYVIVPTHEELVVFQECVDVGRIDCAPVHVAPLNFVIYPASSPTG